MYRLIREKQNCARTEFFSYGNRVEHQKTQ